MEHLLQSVSTSVGGWLYLVAFALVFAETALLIGFVVPGETALLVAGASAHEGGVRLWPLVVVAVVAAVTGDLVGFLVGRRWGEPLRASRVGRWVGPQRWQAVDTALERRGGLAVFLARLTAFLRALMPFAAGSARMPYGVFLPWNAAGGMVWATGVVLLGDVFAGALTTVGRYLTWGPLAVLAVAVVVVVVRHRRRRTA